MEATRWSSKGGDHDLEKMSWSSKDEVELQGWRPRAGDEGVETTRWSFKGGDHDLEKMRWSSKGGDHDLKKMRWSSKGGAHQMEKMELQGWSPPDGGDGAPRVKTTSWR